MSTINKTSVLSQFASAVSALNVSTAETEQLVLYLKTAINAGASANTIITELTDRIETVGGSAAIKELALLIVATSLITEDRVLTVPNLSTLTGMTNAIEGTIFFVESEGFPYIRKSNGDWVVIDPSLQKPATPNAYAWGQNAFGQLGNNTTTSNSSPVSVVGGFTDWVQVSAGRYHSLGVRSNGTAWGWGSNQWGRLGDGTVNTTSSPVSVAGGFTDWVQLSAGDEHSLGVRANGTAWAWGYGLQGRLGTGNANNTDSPTSVIGGFTDWVQLSAGGNHSLGVRANGTAWAWGLNSAGRLGDNTIVSKLSPVSVVGGFTDWVQLSAGGNHSLGVRANGTAWAWGQGNNGQLGNNSTPNSSSPVSVIGGFTDWVQLSAGGSHSIGLRANGTTWCWGRNSYGALGDGGYNNTSSPVSVVGGFTDWVKISAGDLHSLGLRANGTAWSWGNGLFGQLGNNSATYSNSPVSVVGGFMDWIDLQSGSMARHSIGLRGS